jgi:hypothetical protein
MRNSIFYFILFFVLSKNNAQTLTPTFHWEFGVQLGTAYYLGELNQSHFSPLTPSGGLILRYNIDSRLSFRTLVNFAQISGSDDRLQSSFYESRNLSFRNNIYEFGGVVEFNFHDFTTYSLNVFDKKSSVFSPYVYMGLNYFFHKPKLSFNDGDYQNARDLQIESKKYRYNQLALPMGLGLKFRNNRVGFALDWGVRGTLTDYLDDVGSFYSQNLPANDIAKLNYQRGEIFNNDWYVVTGFSFYVNLTSRRMCPN